ncbi:MAG: hypothetical protein H6602_13225 [Flavobacteriales bacterium]|nr:hypothetical protein [Flavobacteriales bacterium]MCB9192617.1 hypothetical protein [Flavobacteriales bacterium]
MKKLLPLLAAILLVSISGCKKDEPQSETIEDDVKALYALHLQIAEQFEASLASYDMADFDAFVHADELVLWAEQLPEVAEISFVTPGVFSITHTNGLKSAMVFSPEEDEAIYITRGGGGSGPMQLYGTNSEEKKITNKKALVIVAHARDFYAPYCTKTGAKHIQDVIDLMEGGDVSLDVTLRVNEGIAAFSDISDYSFIIVNTHGSRDGSFSTGEAVFASDLLASSDPEVANSINDIATDLRENRIIVTTYWNYGTDKQLEVQSASYTLTKEYVANQNWQFDNGVFVANYCYSGVNFGQMGDVLATKGMISFYGYGHPTGKAWEVTNGCAWASEDTVIRSLIYDIDTTGIAHLSNGTELIRDTIYWERFNIGKRKQRLAERYFIFDAQPFEHWLDPDYEYENCETEFTDQRDGKTYAATCIGDQIWMAENLNYASVGMCYDHNPNSCETFGRLYTWNEITGGVQSDASPSGIQGICPEGWHVPSMAEWQELINFAGGSYVAGTRLQSDSPIWYDSDPGTDDYGFAALPAGECDDGDCFNEDDSAGFWTSSRYGVGSNKYILLQGIPSVVESVGTDTQRFSCRCVKDE